MNMRILRVIGIILLLFGLFTTFLELSVIMGFCAMGPFIGPTFVYIAILFLAYDFYKNMTSGKNLFIIIVIIASILYGYYALNNILTNSDCQNRLSISAIREQLSKAQAAPEMVMKSYMMATFGRNTAFISDTFKDVAGEVGVVFECSTEIQSSCKIEDNGTKLTVLNNFNAYVSACCTNALCTVKIGKELAKC